ncbi:lengsin-like isoform X3 [Apostichopus japonicus]|uniref:lengsin-like isoform X3 n=1 Tax=Stichopus japonicus TaxID=307972 RepID=UPI003AB57526
MDATISILHQSTKVELILVGATDLHVIIYRTRPDVEKFKAATQPLKININNLVNRLITQATLMMSLPHIQRGIREKKVSLVRFELSDYYGISHCKAIPARHFEEKVENGLPFYFGHLGFDPQAAIVPGTGYSEETSFGDAIFHSDLTTFRKVPWAKNTARVLTVPKCDGKLVAGYPRTILQRLLGELRGIGYSLLSCHEHEFFVFDAKTKKPVIDGRQIRSTIRLAKNEDFVLQIADQLPEMGVDVESIETEYAPGEYEITYKPAFGVAAADNAFTYKNGIKEIAQKHSLLATFMTKPFPDQVAASAHLNHSLWDVDCEKSLMHDAEEPHGLSKAARHWMAGILYHAPAITVLMSQTVNCLKRLEAHIFAPGNATWAIDNRTTALRVKLNGEKGVYIENRMGSAAGCPYISLAATVAAGMDGLKNQYELPPPVDGIAYDDLTELPPKTMPLPVDMESALEKLVNDEVIREAFGADFIKCFTALKMYEVKLEAEAKANGVDASEWAFGYYSEYM